MTHDANEFVDDDHGDDDGDDPARIFLIALIKHIRNDAQWFQAINSGANTATLNSLGAVGRASFNNALEALRDALMDGLE